MTYVIQINDSGWNVVSEATQLCDAQGMLGIYKSANGVSDENIKISTKDEDGNLTDL